jgi:hypothetical protein
MGTYMLLEINDETSGKIMRSPEPFIMHKPGVYGTLDTRFFTQKELWMYPGVFNYNIKDIATIEVQNNEIATESFSINVLKDGKVALIDNNKTNINVFDTSGVRHYVSHYTDLYYESFANNLDQNQKDSVLALTPNYSFTVTEKNGKTKNVKLWKIKKESEEIGLDQVNFDTGRAYASINNSKDLVKVQFFTWDVLLKPLSYFLPKESSPFQF